jgi:hypothetical protein
MDLLAGAALTLAALLYVFWFTPEEDKREVLYENLRDLHLEYRMGKLSDQDYSQMKVRYQAELAALMHEFQEKPDAPLPVESAATPPPGRCVRCGKDNPVDNRFCGACGAEIPRRETPA